MTLLRCCFPLLAINFLPCRKVPCGNDFLQLIHILKKVHAIGFVSRRLYNFFCHWWQKKGSLLSIVLSPISSYQVFLNDWGCAATTQPIIFRGALRHAPNRIFNVLKKQGVNATYIAQPVDDLQMVVKPSFWVDESQACTANYPITTTQQIFWVSGRAKCWWQQRTAIMIAHLICKLL